MKRLLSIVTLLSACSSAEKATTEPVAYLDAESPADSAMMTAEDTAVADTTPGFDVSVNVRDTSGCVPTQTIETTCNRIDDDCNGVVDDVDVGKDGICDCLGILIL